MTYLLTLSILMSVYLAWQLHRAREERQDLVSQIERAYRAGFREHEAQRAQLEQTYLSHREEIAALHQARTSEVANLLQRIQAPAQAVTSHVADTALPDPPPLNLENDLEMFEAREERLKALGVIGG